MNQRQLASVLFAVLGVFIALSRFPEILIYAAMVADWNAANQDPNVPYSQRLVSLAGLGGTVMLAVVGLTLVLLRDRLADHLFPAGAEPLTPYDLQAVAFSVLGCYFVVQGVSRLVWAASLEWRGATQIVLGLALFFGGRALTRLWSFVRSAGTAAHATQGRV